MLENQDAQAGHRANELSQEDWDFLLRLQASIRAHFPLSCMTLQGLVHLLCSIP